MPLLKSNAVLAIPQIGLSPKLEEVQLAVTRASEYVLTVMRGVAQWSKERLPKVCRLIKIMNYVICFEITIAVKLILFAILLCKRSPCLTNMASRSKLAGQLLLEANRFLC